MSTHIKSVTLNGIVRIHRVRHARQTAHPVRSIEHPVHCMEHPVQRKYPHGVRPTKGRVHQTLCRAH